MPKRSERVTVGWREWVSLPELRVPAVKAKVDTGARTSAIHAHGVREFQRRDTRWLRFRLYPLQNSKTVEIVCEAPILDERTVTDSGGHREKRFVISTSLRIGDTEFPIEMTVTRRDNMRFRMLLGRTAVAKRFVVDPGRSFLMGRQLARAYEGRKQ